MVKLQYFLDLSRQDGNYIPYHYHPCYELVFYGGGTGTNRYIPSLEVLNSEENFTFEQPGAASGEPQQVPFEKNVLFFYKPYSYHDETHLKGGPILALGFTSDTPINLQRTVYTALPPELTAHIHMMAQENREKNEGFLDAINCMIELLVIYLSRLENRNNPSQPNMETIRNYIDNYYMTNIKISDLAKSLFYTTDHFIRVFNREFGVHPKQYVLKKRLEESLSLLKNTDITVHEIAARVGYNSNSEFSAFIKKSTGQTPTQIRRNAIRAKNGQQSEPLTVQIPGIKKNEGEE